MINSFMNNNIIANVIKTLYNESKVKLSWKFPGN